MLLHRSVVCILLTVLVGLSENSLSATMNYQLTGWTSTVDPLFSSISPSVQWTASFSIDSAASDISTDAQIGKYPGIVGEVQINGFVVLAVNPITFTNTFMNVGNQWPTVSPDYDFLDFNGDQSNGSPASAALIDGLAIDEFEIGIGNWSGTMLSGTSLNGTVNVDTGDIEGSMFQLLSGSHQINGYVQTISVSTVPTPSAVLLFGSGLLGLVGAARKKMVT